MKITVLLFHNKNIFLCYFCNLVCAQVISGTECLRLLAALQGASISIKIEYSLQSKTIATVRFLVQDKIKMLLKAG